MKRTLQTCCQHVLSLSVVFLILTQLHVVASENVLSDESSDPLVRVIVEFSNLISKQRFSLRDAAFRSVGNDRRPYVFERANAMAMTVKSSEISDLEADPDVLSVRRDKTMSWHQEEEEVTPWGIGRVQGNGTVIPIPSFSGNCSDPESFKICVVDSGLLVSHDDIPFQVDSASIIGTEFGLDESLHWYNPGGGSTHGTHVTGTILAEGGNGIGVVGVVDNPAGVCLLIARVFDDSGSQDNSYIIEAAEWCGDMGADVINMSLGDNSGIDKKFEDVLDALNDEGALVIASAGNGGSDDLAYPASHPTVISVGAIDEENVVAPFSQYNEEVDLVAPGVRILSTTSDSGLTVVSLGVTLSINIMKYSVSIPDDMIDVPLQFSDCDSGFSKCSGVSGKACVMKRGDTDFSEKALNCQKGGGILAIIYNNRDGAISGSLGSSNSGVEIPVVSLTQSDGEELLSAKNSDILVTDASPSYALSVGTSMSSPHVTGVIAKVWMARPECTNAQVREAVEATALDLGDEGRDDYYGHGLIQAEDAYQYLATQFDPPCGIATEDVIATSTCLENFVSCDSNDDCCSGRCVASTLNGPTICRSAPKTSREKLGGTSRGGAAGGNRRNLRHLSRARGA